MMSAEYIRHLSNVAAVQAVLAGEGQPELIEPWPVTNVFEVNAWESSQRWPFPNLGNLRPAGWKLSDQWMVDATGMGYDYEPALTNHQLAARIREAAEQGLPRAYAIIETGQFQVVLGVFEPDPEAKLTLAGNLDDSDWDSIAEDLGFESGADLRSYTGL